jgi:hypothetical protein
VGLEGDVGGGLDELVELGLGLDFGNVRHCEGGFLEVNLWKLFVVFGDGRVEGFWWGAFGLYKFSLMEG